MWHWFILLWLSIVTIISVTQKYGNVRIGKATKMIRATYCTIHGHTMIHRQREEQMTLLVGQVPCSCVYSRECIFSLIHNLVHILWIIRIPKYIYPQPITHVRTSPIYLISIALLRGYTSEKKTHLSRMHSYLKARIPTCRLPVKPISNSSCRLTGKNFAEPISLTSWHLDIRWS